MEVLAPLIDKLTTMVSDGYKKLKGVEQQATFLKSELSAMSAALETLELKDELKPDEKNWRDQVREMAYDMEDCIDDLILNLEKSDDKTGLIQKTFGKLKTLPERHRIAGQMKDLKVLAVEANERRRRYEIDGRNTSSSIVAVDPRMSAIYNDAANLIGIDGPREEVTSWLIDTEEKLKVVSIVGFGGLGKTTLAKQLFDKIGNQFDCKAFVPISQRPNVLGLLKIMQSKLGIEQKRKNEELGINESSQNQTVQDIVDQFIEHLKHKRYLILVDDLWDQSAWDAISCAFPENGNGSRIIVTTRLEDVACYACSNRQQFVYRMKRLDDQDSKRLLFNRICGSRPFHFEEVAAQILRRCDGLPLAIITIASLLASHPETLKKDWETIRKYLNAQSAIAGNALERMQHILPPICFKGPISKISATNAEFLHKT